VGRLKRGNKQDFILSLTKQDFILSLQNKKKPTLNDTHL
jgi:hypothetical protein